MAFWSAIVFCDTTRVRNSSAVTGVMFATCTQKTKQKKHELFRNLINHREKKPPQPEAYLALEVVAVPVGAVVRALLLQGGPADAAR